MSGGHYDQRGRRWVSSTEEAEIARSDALYVETLQEPTSAAEATCVPCQGLLEPFSAVCLSPALCELAAPLCMRQWVRSQRIMRARMLVAALRA